MKPIIIAFGGNALIRENEIGNYAQQIHNCRAAVKELVPLIKKEIPIVIVHGNGPQVGNLEIQMHSTRKIPSMPLDVEVGMTQGQIGHFLTMGLKHWLPNVEAAAILTHVEVDKKDTAFRVPSKPIGPWEDEKQAMRWKKERIHYLFDPKKGYRKMVASPQPKKIIEIETIQQLLDAHSVVIACGGGGIPIVREKKGWKGVEAVIDKDRAAQVVANTLHAEKLVILTNEERAYRDFYSKKPIPLEKLSLHEAQILWKKGEFGEGSMAPKIEACIRFIQKGGKTAYIGKTGKMEKVMRHETGTRIIR
ncbi:MAG: carbamate kinase [Candidatus Diapherotrites archaeon]